MKIKMEKGNWYNMKDKIKTYGFILLIAVIVSIPLFSNRFNIYADDGIQHVCRLIGTWSSICEGQLFPVNLYGAHI